MPCAGAGITSARRERRAGRVAALALVTVHLAAPALLAQPSEPAGADGPAVTFGLRTSIKASLLASHAPDDPVLFPVRDTAVSFWRMRAEPSMRAGEHVTIAAAYEQRLRVFNQAPGLSGGNILPGDVDAPYRLRQFDWSITTREGLVWRHEIDRASVAWTLPSDVTLTVGRQAVGWGRGVMFSAADLFAPFSPLEADREWRRGVDAIRLEVPLSARSSAEAVAALGPSVDRSVFAGRVRGYAGKTDVELIGGRRARDAFVGVTSSAAIGNAEVHGELVVFRAKDAVATDAHPVAKGVLGGSYRLGIGPGILAFVEYHYSGFGVGRPEEIVSQLADPEFRVRVVRGDTQILGRHAIAVTASSELSPEWTLAGQWLHSPADGSGVIVPSATCSLGDAASVVVSTYVPYGRPPRQATLRSEYGAQGPAFFAQLRIYR